MKSQRHQVASIDGVSPLTVCCSVGSNGLNSFHLLFGEVTKGSNCVLATVLGEWMTSLVTIMKVGEKNVCTCRRSLVCCYSAQRDFLYQDDIPSLSVREQIVSTVSLEICHFVSDLSCAISP